MPRYEVTRVQIIAQSISEQIEAESEEGAIEELMDLLANGYVEWKIVECLNDETEVVAMEDKGDA